MAPKPLNVSRIRGRRTPWGSLSPEQHHGGDRSRPGAALRRFRREEHGATAIEITLATSLLVFVSAALMTFIANSLATEDRMARAAHAAARTIALLPSAPASTAALETVACGAIRSELGDESLDCAAQWTITISAYENPIALLEDTERSGGAIGGENGDMVEVRIGPPSDAGTPDTGPSSVLAVGVARNERDTRTE